MEKPISRKAHGFAEYAFVPLSSAAPELFSFTDEPRAKQLCRTIGAGVMLSALVTRAEWGVVKIVPFKTHLLVDFSLGIFALAAPRLFGFSHSRNAARTFLALGITSLVIPLLTQNKEMKDE